MTTVLSGRFVAYSQTQPHAVWHVSDTITPTLDTVQWVEEGNYSKPPSWISDHRWYEAHSRQTLIGSDDIFVSLTEVFNFTAMNAGLTEPYASFDEFETEVKGDPSWWLLYSWGMDADWYGIPLNRTKVNADFNPSTARTEVQLWCHITHIPEYMVGEKHLETWLTGFDLTAISIGKLEDLEWYEDHSANGSQYHIYFKAPANILSQYKDTYSLSLGVSPLYRNTTYNVEQVIQFSMPPNTDVKSASPSNMFSSKGNVATFTVHEGDRYPNSYSVTSGPPVKDFGQSFAESAARWLVEPSIWVAFGTLTLLLYTAFRGKRMVNKRNMYYRLYKGMINVYNHYSANFAQFSQEMGNLSDSIFNSFIEDRINDDQLDKLLSRRDDLMERARKLPPPP